MSLKPQMTLMARPLITLIILVALIVVVLLVVNAFGGRGEAIAEARAEATRLEHERDSLIDAVQEHDQEQSALISEREVLESEATNLRQSVAKLEQQRAARQLTVREIRTVGALQNRLRNAFPELGHSAWGLTTVPLEGGDTLGLDYLMVPAWFAETFAIDRANAESWRAQKDQLLAVDSLRLVISVLQDSVLVLEAANAYAYETGYRNAYTNYQDLSRRYIAELNRPRIRVAPALVGLLGAVGVGVVIGSQIP
jgi:hypothetical protein